MTTQQYKKLREFEEKFNETSRGYVRVTRTEMDRFSEIYREIYGKEVNRTQRTCPHCIMRLFKTVGEDYRKFEQSPAYKKLMKKENGTGETNDTDA